MHTCEDHTRCYVGNCFGPGHHQSTSECPAKKGYTSILPDTKSHFVRRKAGEPGGARQRPTGHPQCHHSRRTCSSRTCSTLKRHHSKSRHTEHPRGCPGIAPSAQRCKPCHVS